jgi:hypothetical protein
MYSYCDKIDVTGRDDGQLVGTLLRRLYLNEVEGQGSGPRRRGGVVTPPYRQGRIVQR